MVTKISANYGKYSVEVEGQSFVEALKQLSVAEDVFGDAYALGKDANGQVVRHDNVIVTHRVTKENHSYFGMRAIGEGPLRGYQREIGQYQAPRLGEVFTKRDPLDPNKFEQGLLGWGKYKSQNNGGGYQQQQSNGQQSYGGQPQGYQGQPAQQPQQGYSAPQSQPSHDESIPF